MRAFIVAAVLTLASFATAGPQRMTAARTRIKTSAFAAAPALSKGARRGASLPPIMPAVALIMTKAIMTVLSPI